MQKKLAAQRQDAPIGSRINRGIETAESGAAAAVSQAQAVAGEAVARASQAQGALQSLGQLFDMLTALNTMAAAPSGEANVNAMMQSLKSAMQKSPADPGALGAAVDAARKDDPALQSVVGSVSAKDLGAAAMLLMLNELRGDVQSERPFQEDLAVIAKFSANDPEMQAALARLAPYAESGVLSPQTLQAEFKGLAGEIVMAKLRGEDASVRDRVLQRLGALVQVRRVDDIEGNTVDATVARAQLMLDQGNVHGAVAELQKLDGAPAQAAQPWMQAAQGSLAAQDSTAALMNAVLQKFSAVAQGMPVQSVVGDVMNQIEGLLQGGAGGRVLYMSPAMQAPSDRDGSVIAPMRP
jgi:hypothetical protein